MKLRLYNLRTTHVQTQQQKFEVRMRNLKGFLGPCVRSSVTSDGFIAQ